MSVLEVERLWSRFRQMGCNEDGFLSENAMTQPELTDNIFMKNVSNNDKESRILF